METRDNYISDALLAEALDAFEATAMPFTPTCIISTGFCPNSPHFSMSNSSLAGQSNSALDSPFLLASSSASTPPLPNPISYVNTPTSSSLYPAAATNRYRYAPPKTDREIDKARLLAVPQRPKMTQSTVSDFSKIGASNGRRELEK